MPCLPTAKEFSISSPSFFTLTAPVLRSIVPTLPPCFETNQIRPEKSGRAEVIRSVLSSSTPVRSKSRLLTRLCPLGDWPITKMWSVLVGTQIRSLPSRKK